MEKNKNNVRNRRKVFGGIHKTGTFLPKYCENLGFPIDAGPGKWYII
jgi:hypothetical protein